MISDEIGAKSSRGLFSPRMDYEQWKPLGRGDPLQNDPTYDYVPPVLERVHYWVEPPTRKQDGSSPHEGKKSEILVLGVSSKKSSTSPPTAENRRDPYESFLKFIDGPKFTNHNHNSHVRTSQGQRPPHTQPHVYHSQFYKNRFDDGHYKSDEQRMPYTVLVPPPIPPPHMELPLFKPNPPPPSPPSPATTARPVYTPPTTTTAPRPTVALQEANLVYYSSSDAGNNQWQKGASQYEPGSQYATWRTPTEKPSNVITFQESETQDNPVVFKINSSSSANTVRFGQTPVRVSQPLDQRPHNSPIVFPTETGRIVFEHHSSYNPNSVHGSISQGPLRIPTSEIMLGQSPMISAATRSPPLHVLHVAGSQPAATQMAVGNQPMHKGQVSDDTIGNTYVNIGKPNAHIQKEITTNIPYISSPVYTTTEQYKNTYEPFISSAKPVHHVLQALPANYLNNQINSVYTSGSSQNTNLINNGQPFNRRPGPITDDIIMHSMQTMQTLQTMQPPPPSRFTSIKTTKKPSGFLHSLLHKEYSTEKTILTSSLSYTPATSTTPTPTTTAVASLTTDPLFKHYKQPMEPLRGPMYLIIQGHSKVKTYGPSNKEILRDFSMPENNEIPQLDKYPVKHLHGHKENKEDTQHSRTKNGRTLKDLVNVGYGNFQEAEIGVKYEVSDDKTLTTSEKYHKGIVESEENEMAEIQKLKKLAKIRKKRQLEEFIPVVEDTVETYVYDYLKRQSEGSGVGAIVASAITNDSSEYDINVLEDDDEEDDDDEDDDNEVDEDI